MPRPTVPMNPACQQMQRFHMDGNIIPHSWYHAPRLQRENGKPNLVAITLLGDVLYWYRPVEVRDEASGKLLGYRQKFAADKLAKNYAPWGDSFGFTLRQVEDAMAFLKAAGVVTVEVRISHDALGKISATAFIEPVVDAIRSITYPPDTLESLGDVPHPVTTGSGGTLLHSGGKTAAPSPVTTGCGPRHRIPLQREHSETTPERLPNTMTAQESAADSAPFADAPEGVGEVIDSSPSQRSEEPQVIETGWDDDDFELSSPAAPAPKPPARSSARPAPKVARPPTPKAPNATAEFLDAFARRGMPAPRLLPRHHANLRDYRKQVGEAWSQAVEDFIDTPWARAKDYEVCFLIGKTPEYWAKSSTRPVTAAMPTAIDPAFLDNTSQDAPSHCDGGWVADAPRVPPPVDPATEASRRAFEIDLAQRRRARAARAAIAAPAA